MFKRKQKGSNNDSNLELIITPKLLEVLSIEEESATKPIHLTDQHVVKLLEYLETISASPDLKAEFVKEMSTFVLRKLQLQETKEVVYSLREADETSDEALDFLMEKMDLLNSERLDIIKKFLTLREELKSIPVSDYLPIIENLVVSIDFIDTTIWEKNLDYYRTRFLMQKEQDEDLERKEKFRPLEDKVSSVYRDPLSKPKQDTKIILKKPSIQLIVPKSFQKKLDALATTYNKLLNEFPKTLSADLLELNQNEIQQRLPQQRAKNLATGKELYTLKKEQGILTLKNYEIVQTLKSRLLNITGSIASRSFLANGFKDLINTAKNSQLTDSQKNKEIIKTITRLLRILGELKPGEELKD